MPFIVLTQRLAFQKTQPDNPTVPDGPEEIVERGANVPDYVPTYILNALVSAGTIVYADRPDAGVVPDSALAPQVRTPDQPAVLPSDPNGSPMRMADLSGGQDDAVTGDNGLPPLPKASDNKETWETFAQKPFIGFSQGDAEAMSKATLMDAVKTRYAAAEAAE